MKRISLILILSLVCLTFTALADGYHTITGHDVEIRFEVVSATSVKLYSVTNKGKEALKVKLDGVEQSEVLKPGKTIEYGGAECKLIQTVVGYGAYTILNERILGRYLESIRPPSSEPVAGKSGDASGDDVKKTDTEVAKPDVQGGKTSDVQAEKVEEKQVVNQVKTETEVEPEIQKKTGQEKKSELQKQAEQTRKSEIGKQTGPEKKSVQQKQAEPKEKPDLRKQLEQEKKPEARKQAEPEKESGQQKQMAQETKPVRPSVVSVPDGNSDAGRPEPLPAAQDSADSPVPDMTEPVSAASPAKVVLSGDVMEAFVSELDSDGSFFSDARLEDLTKAVRNYKAGLDTCTNAIRRFKFIRNQHLDIYLDHLKCDLADNEGRIAGTVSSFMDKYQVEKDSASVSVESLSAFLSGRAAAGESLIDELENSMDVGTDFPTWTYSLIILTAAAVIIILPVRRIRRNRKSVQ